MARVDCPFLCFNFNFIFLKEPVNIYLVRRFSLIGGAPMTVEVI
jgi:hypothetical protein